MYEKLKGVCEIIIGTELEKCEYVYIKCIVNRDIESIKAYRKYKNKSFEMLEDKVILERIIKLLDVFFDEIGFGDYIELDFREGDLISFKVDKIDMEDETFSFVESSIIWEFEKMGMLYGKDSYPYEIVRDYLNEICEKLNI